MRMKRLRTVLFLALLSFYTGAYASFAQAQVYSQSTIWNDVWNWQKNAISLSAGGGAGNPLNYSVNTILNDVYNPYTHSLTTIGDNGTNTSSPFAPCAYWATSSAASVFGSICVTDSPKQFAFTSTDSSTPYTFPNSSVVLGTTTPFVNTFLTIDPTFMTGVTSTIAPNNPTVDAFTIGYDGPNRNINTAFVIQNNNDPEHGLFMANQAEPDPVTQKYMGYIRVSGGYEQNTEWQTGYDFGGYPGEFSINPHQGTLSVGLRASIASSSIDSIYFNLASTTPGATIASNTFAVMNGNMGVGTTTPSTALVVDGTSTFAGNVQIGSAGNYISDMFTASGTLSFADVGPYNECSTTTLAIPGASDGDPLNLGVPNIVASSTNILEFGYISGPDVATLKICGIPSAGGGVVTTTIPVATWKIIATHF